MKYEGVSLTLFQKSRISYPEQDRVLNYLLEGWFEVQEQCFVNQFLRKGDTFLDIGAHAGLYSVLAGKAVGAAGRVIACEPGRHIRAWLQNNLNTKANFNTAELPKKGVGILANAISNQSGTLDFFESVEAATAYSSLHENFHSAEKHTVPCTTLDRLVKEADIESIALIKVDIEGAEHLFLEGGSETLRSHPDIVLMMEFSEDAQNQFGMTTAELGKLVRELGLKCFSLDLVHDELHELRDTSSLWFDNLIITRDPAVVLKRLETASPAVVRLSREEIRRGRARISLYRKSQWVDRLSKDVVGPIRMIGEIQAQLSGQTDTLHRFEAQIQHLSDSKADSPSHAHQIIRLMENELGRLKGMAEYYVNLLQSYGPFDHEVKDTDNPELSLPTGITSELLFATWPTTLKAMDYRIAEIHQEKEELSNKLAITQQMLENNKKELKTLRCDYERLQLELKDSGKCVDDLRKNKQDLELQLAQEEQRSENYKMDIEKKFETINIQSATIKKLEEKIQAQKDRDEWSEETISMLTKELQNLSEKLAPLRRLQSEILVARQDLKALGDMALELNKGHLNRMGRPLGLASSRVIDRMVSIYTARDRFPIEQEETNQ